jgi:hypothetical protein
MTKSLEPTHSTRTHIDKQPFLYGDGDPCLHISLEMRELRIAGAKVGEEIVLGRKTALKI